MPTLHGWKSGLAGAAALTVGVVIAALIVSGLTSLHGGDPHVSVPSRPWMIPLAPGQLGVPVASASTPSGTNTSAGGPARATATPQNPHLNGRSGPIRERRPGAQAPTPQVPGSGGDPRDQTPPGSPAGATPKPGGGGGGGGGGGDPRGPQPQPSLGDTVKNTTGQLGNTVDGTTQTVGNTVGTVSPALGNTVTQTGSVLGDTVKNTGDTVGNTVNGLLGGRH